MSTTLWTIQPNQCESQTYNVPDSKINEAHLGPGGPRWAHVGHTILAIWGESNNAWKYIDIIFHISFAFAFFCKIIFVGYMK